MQLLQDSLMSYLFFSSILIFTHVSLISMANYHSYQGCDASSISHKNSIELQKDKYKTDIEMFRAAYRGDQISLITLLNQGAKCNGPYSFYFNSGKASARSALFINSNLSPLHIAASRGHLDCVGLLLSKGALIDAQTRGSWLDISSFFNDSKAPEFWK